MDNLNGEETTNVRDTPGLPFHNLFLNAGFVEGCNNLWMYLFTLSATILGYLLIGSILIMPLVQKALAVGITQTELINNQFIIFDSERLGINKNIILLIQFGLFVAAFLAFFF